MIGMTVLVVVTSTAATAGSSSITSRTSVGAPVSVEIQNRLRHTVEVQISVLVQCSEVTTAAAFAVKHCLGIVGQPRELPRKIKQALHSTHISTHSPCRRHQTPCSVLLFQRLLEAGPTHDGSQRLPESQCFSLSQQCAHP